MGPRSPSRKVVRGLAVGDGEGLDFADGFAEGLGDGLGAFVVLGDGFGAALVVGEGVADDALCVTVGTGVDAVGALTDGAALDTDGDGVSGATDGGAALVVLCCGAAASEDQDAPSPAHPPRTSAPARARPGVAARTLR